MQCFFWLGRRGSNPRMTESKSVALPLGYSPPYLNIMKKMGWDIRVELMTSSATNWRPNQLGQSHHIFCAYEDSSSPCGAMARCGGLSSQLSKGPPDLSPNRLTFCEPLGVRFSSPCDALARCGGLEPPAYCLEGSCSIQLS